MLYRSELTFDLFPCPTCRVDCSRGEFTVRFGLLDQSCDPFVPIPLRDLAVGEGIRKVTVGIRKSDVIACLTV